MKKKFAAFALAFTLVFQAQCFRPHEAHAIIGSAMVNMAIIGAAVCIMGVGAAGVTISSRTPGIDDEAMRIGVISSLSTMLLGLVLLDEESGMPSYGPLTDELITGAALTEDEVMAYQLELPELNLAVAATTADLASQGVTTAEEAMARPEAWRSRAAHLMPETSSALSKIGEYLRTQTQAH